MFFNLFVSSGAKRFLVILFSLVILAIISFPGNFYNALARPGNEKIVLPKQLIDIDGRKIDLEKLAGKKKLFFVTLKATWCPVCFNQLLRLKKLLPKLRVCDASFIVLSPGPLKELKSIQAKSKFPYPFIEDKNLKLARKLNLILAPNQIQPVIFAVNKNREIVWMQYGRNGRYYGDKELQEYLDCEFELAANF
jgi:peroxiredoxin